MQSAGSPAGRLAWQCRRGMKELDLVLTRYLREQWPQADAAARRCFEQILELPDPLLAAYLMGRETPADPQLQQLVDQLRRIQSAPAAATAADIASQP
ncbi:MAG: succinate dehydrogenase assembly factor 2 [Steroidobacteraceae bacterium]